MDHEPISISALQHWHYCPRQCALIHLDQVFDDNVYTLRGQAVHSTVDTPGFENQHGYRIERALPIWSDRLGLIGKCDVVEFWPDGTVYPVEYKHGSKKQRENDDLQLAAQAICLGEMLGKAVTHGAIFHAASKRRREIIITSELADRVTGTVFAIRSMLAQQRLPLAVYDNRCPQCSLQNICQPRATSEQAANSLRAKLFDPEA